MDRRYTWGYHSSDESHVHVSFGSEDLFDVSLYDKEVVDEATQINGEDQSLIDLRRLIGYANAALEAGLDPAPVPDKESPSIRTYTGLRDFLDGYTDPSGTIQGDPAIIAAEAVARGLVERDGPFAQQHEDAR